MSGFTLDSGALIAAERGDKRVIALLDRLERRKIGVAIPAGVLSQVWRAGPRQHRLHLLMTAETVDVVALDRNEALLVGALLARSGSADVVDGSVASCAKRRGHAVITSDPDDISRIDGSLVLVHI